MSLEPFAGILIAMARSVKAILDQGLQVTIARTEPRSQSLDIHRRIAAKLNLPHSIRDLTFAFVESLDLTTKRAVEINTNLSRRGGIHLSIVIDANVSD